MEFADGTTEKVWCTFAEEQVDLNMASKTGVVIGLHHLDMKTLVKMLSMFDISKPYLCGKILQIGFF